MEILKNVNRPRISFLNKKTKRNIKLKSNKKNIYSINKNSNKSSKVNVNLQSYNSDSNSDSDSVIKIVNTSSSLFHSSKSEILNIYDNPLTKEKIFLIKNKNDFCFIGKGLLRIIYGSINVFGYEISSENDLNDYEFDVSENYNLYTCYNKGTIINSDDGYSEIKNACDKFITNKNSKLNLPNIKAEDKISIIFFKELSNNFRIIANNELLNTHFFDYINLHKYEDYESEISNDQKKFLICGKRNSGKSTFLLYLINRFLSKINEAITTVSTRQTHPFLFLIDCDSGQPLLSSPFNVSLLKISKPIFRNYFKIGSVEEYETIRSIIVEENSPSNNYEEYLKSIEILNDTFNKIKNNKMHYLIINTNGYTSGLGYIINSTIIDIFKPDLNFYTKNSKAGRLEKGEEFEKYILNQNESESMEIIFRANKIERNKSKRGKSTNIENRSIVIQNNFELNENRNTENKNLNKNLYVYANMIGNEFSLNNEKFKNNKNFSLTDLKFSSNKHILPLIEIPFDNLIFSFNFTDFKPNNDLDVLLSINSKMCFILPFQFSDESNIEINQEFKVIDFKRLSYQDRNFLCFAFIYNINIIERKIIVMSNYLKEIYSEDKNKSGIIIYRNMSALDKSIQFTKESCVFQTMITQKKFSSSKTFCKFSDLNTREVSKEYYFTRNKFSLL